jgi:hypothetical protein
MDWALTSFTIESWGESGKERVISGMQTKLELGKNHRQDKPPVFFNIVVPGVGLELPPFGDVSPIKFRFSVATFPFSFLFLATRRFLS